LAGDNRNYGIQHARGRYVCCLDPADRLDPIHIEVSVYLAECAGFDVVHQSVRCFGESSLGWLTVDARFWTSSRRRRLDGCPVPQERVGRGGRLP
jgi:hypothetical protein